MSAESKKGALKGAGVAALSFAIVVVLFTANVPGPVAVPLGVGATLACAFAVAKACDPESFPIVDGMPRRRIGRELVVLVASLMLVHVFLVASVAGLLGNVAAGICNTFAFVLATHAAYRLHDAASARKGSALWKRASFLAIVGQVLVTLPLLGAFGLVDPWETHYGEVAREMIARHDPLSPFWANEGFFRTKPVLDFWVQALAFRATGVDCSSGNMLVGAFGHVARPEWAARYPTFLMALFGNVMLARGVARSFGQRAGLFVALVLATTAHFALLAHQSITDMPLVASVSASFGLWLSSRGISESMASRGKALGLGPFVLVVSPARLATALFVALLVPEVALLVSRNLDFSLSGPLLHADRIVTGSAGNEGFPGQILHSVERVQFPRIWPIHQALFFVFLGLVVATFVASFRKVRELLVVCAFVVASVGTLAKGPAGFVFLCAVVGITWLSEERTVRRSAMAAYAVGGLALAVLVVPWFLAMHVRHGRAFTDELVMRHMIGRTLEHLHDTNEGDDTSARYYLWQLGYGLFPWTGLVPAALSTWGRPSASPAREKVRFALVAWALVAFGLVTIMKTKFHHYVFPAVPPIAALLGIELDRVLDEPFGSRGRSARHALAFVGAVLTLAVGADFFAGPESYPGHGQARLMHLFTYLYRRSWPEGLDFRAALGGVTVLAALATLAFALRRGRRRVVLGMGAVAASFTVFLLDVYLVRAAPHWGQRELVAEWVALRGPSTEPLVAWQMNWKGENFYAGNRVAIFLNGRPNLSEHLAKLQRAGKTTTFAVCEHGRLSELTAEAHRAGAFRVVPRTTPRQNDKFVLVELTAPPTQSLENGALDRAHVHSTSKPNATSPQLAQQPPRAIMSK